MKFASGTSLTVNSGATIDARGTCAEPIVFTSVRADANGGDTNGGKGATVVQTLKYGKAAKLAKCKFKSPKGKKFAGWATSKANAKKGKVKYKNAQAVKNLIITGKTVKLYAVWKEEEMTSRVRLAFFSSSW